MAQKPSFLKRITTASTVAFAAAAIVGTGSTALGAALTNRTTIADPATLNNGTGLDQDATPADLAFATGSALTLGGAHDVDTNGAANLNIVALYLGANDGQTFTVTNSVTIGSVKGAAAEIINFDIAANQTLTFTGTGVTAAVAGAAKAADVAKAAPFGPAGAGIADNIYTGFGKADFTANPSTLEFNLTIPTTEAAPLVLGANATVDNGANGTLNITKGFIQVSDKTFATIKAIKVEAGNGIIFNSTETAAGVLNLQTIANNGITLAGDAKLILKSNAGAGNAVSFKAVTGTLGATGGDNNGVIVFDASGAGANASLTSNKAGNAVAVVGTNDATRAQGFIVKGNGAADTTIDGEVYAKAVELQGGKVIFGQIVNVGANGTTVFTKAASQATFSKSSNLGAVTFGAFAGNTLTLTSAAANTTLTGNFTGDATAANFPTMLFAGANTSALAAADKTQPVVKNFQAIENTVGQAVTLGAGTYTTDLNISNANGSFILADGFELTGNVNATKGANALAAGKLTAQGNATISGDIGFNATAGKGQTPLGDITVADVADKTLTLGGANVIGNNGASINYGANNGGIVKLTNTGNNILVKYNLALAADAKGVFDASSLTDKQTLTISGSIGTFDAAVAPAIKTASKSLEQLAIGEGNLVLSAGDAAINSLIMGDNSTVTLAHNTYKIVTTNSGGNGTVVISPDVADPNNGTTLASGTKLGANGSSLKEIKFKLTGVTQGGTDVTLNVGQDVNLYATNITTDTNNKGSFFFTGGGKNIVNGAIGTAGTGLFNTITVDANTTVALQGPALFNGITTINNGGTLQLSGNYQTDSINTSGAGGTLEFTNTDPINVNLKNTGAAALNTLAALKVSGGNVTILQTANGAQLAMNTPKLITFNNANLGASSTLTLPVGMKLNGVNISSNAGNKNFRGVAVSGVDHVIASTEAIGSNGNPVSIILNSDNGVTVETPNFFGGIFTSQDNKGAAMFNVADGAGRVDGLGGATQKLGTVLFATSTTNTGNTRVYNSIIADGETYTAGGTIDTAIQLGNAAGTGNVVFLAGTNLLPTTTIEALVANKGNVTFQDSLVGLNAAIGESGTPVALVEFIGTTPNTNPDVAAVGGYGVALNQSIYSGNINFGKYAIEVGIPEVTLSGASAVNNVMFLESNKLTFTGGASTWGPNTSIHTTLANNTLGSIVISNGTVTAADNILTTVVIDDQDSLGATTQSYPLIKGGTNLTLANGKTVSLAGTTFTSNQRFSAYSIIQDSNKDYLLQRQNIAAKVIAGDLTANSQYSNIPGLAPNVAAILDINNTGDASKFLTNIGNLNSADTAQAIVAVTAQDTNNLAVMQDIAADNISVLTNRVHGVRYLQGPAGAPEDVLVRPEGGVVGAADAAEDNVSYGGWAKAIYSDATQKSKGGVAGYDAKTTGGIFGFDTMANDNLMIGAAIGVTKTDMKYKNYRAGDKSTINGFSFSLYGAQQLVDNFFFQGATTFSTNQVKGKSKRYMAGDTGQKVTETASASYDNLTYAAEGMFGYDAKVMENVLLTPMAGIRYIKSSDESYKETGTTFQNKSVAGKFSDKTDVIVGARVIGDSMNLSQFMFYPEAHAFVTHKVSGKLAKIQSSLDGQVTPFIGQPDKTDKTSYNLGLSVTARPGPQMEYGIGYDANLASKYVAHTGTLKVRVNF